MPCTVVVGGQYGAEGKGKVVALAANLHREPWVVRCGGPNSGHTIRVDDRDVVLRQVPAGAIHPAATLLMAAGCVIDPDLLVAEADALGVSRERLVVDPRAAVVSEADREAELASVGRIGSTGSGTGAALVRRMQRGASSLLAGQCQKLSDRVRIETVAPLLHHHLDRGGFLIVEGTQGFGLSLLHGPHYPFVTARDTTASGFAAEVGLSPRQIDCIILVVRTFPIRVGGNSGPLSQEISWDTVMRLSAAPSVVPELTSVTRRPRRVALFDVDFVKTACRYNRPTSMAVMGMDRLDYANHAIPSAEDLTPRGRAFLTELRSATGVPIEWIGTGYGTSEALRLSPAQIETYDLSNSR